MYVANDASESFPLSRIPGPADEIMTGWPQNSAYMYIMHDKKS